MNIDWDIFWWDKITGAQYLVTKTASLLLSSKNTILSVPFDCPWRHQLRDEIEKKYKEQSLELDTFFYIIDVTDDCHDILPGDYLLERFGKRRIKNGYRTKSSISIQDYIRLHGILANTIIWIKGIPKEKVYEWIKFCSNYTTNSLNEGIFLLEIQDNFYISDIANIEVVKFTDFITRYDVQVFNSFILNSQKNLPEIWKIYISAVVSTLCDIDAEISEILIRVIDFSTDDPIVGIKKIAEMPEYLRRGGQENSLHVLSLYRNKKIDLLNYKIWTSQIQILFPLIEMEKIKILEEMKDEVQNVLENNHIIQYGGEIKDIDDIEIGTLSYMISSRNTSGDYLLYITDKSVRDRIHFLRECRNCLAHGDCCTPQQVTQLLQYH